MHELHKQDAYQFKTDIVEIFDWKQMFEINGLSSAQDFPHVAFNACSFNIFILAESSLLLNCCKTFYLIYYHMLFGIEKIYHLIAHLNLSNCRLTCMQRNHFSVLIAIKCANLAIHGSCAPNAAVTKHSKHEMTIHSTHERYSAF